MEHVIVASIEQFDFNVLKLELTFISSSDNDHVDFELVDFEVVGGEHTEARSLEEIAVEYFDSEAGQSEAMDVYYRDIEGG